MAPVIGAGISQYRGHAAGITNPHGFSMEWLRVPAGGGVSRFRIGAKQVLLAFRGQAEVVLNGPGDEVALPMAALDMLSVPAGVWRAVDLIEPGAEVIICLDLDAFDPGVMPAVIGRTAGGMGYWQVLELIGGVAERARIAGFDMVELMPERDIDGQGALLAAQVLAGVLGVIARQRG